MSTVVVLGAGGRAGSASVRELVDQGHEVVAAVRRPGRTANPIDPRARVVEVDVTDVAGVARAAEGCEIVVDATRHAGDIPADHLVQVHTRVREGMVLAGVARVVVVGGAGALRLATGRWFWEHPAFPSTTTPRGAAHARLRQHLEAMPTTVPAWSYLIPPPRFDPSGARTGRVRVAPATGPEDVHLVRSISYADFAHALAIHVADPAASGVVLVSGAADPRSATGSASP